MKKSYVTLLAGFGLCFPVLFFYRHQEGFDNVLYPYPLLVFVPILFGLRWAAFAVPTMCFFLWNQGLFRGEGNVPKRSYILFVTVALLSIPWFAVSWKYALAVQGARYYHTVLLVNIVCVVCLFAFFAFCRQTASFATNLLCHWILFAWLTWYAFPFFGEFL